ncbi:MAG TPA: TonB-dependent receptor plug domain-containing protein [Sphingobacteriaceae bacterium]
MKFRPITFLFLLFISSFAYGQMPADDHLKKVISQLQQYQADRPYEKIHLHLDKPYYAIGDNIWFKAYVVQAEKNQPSYLSKILYVDLINEKDSIKQTLKLPVFVGLAWGEFSLKDSLKEGNYRIRAYTNWMRNFGEDYFFDKTITIGNAITNNIITGVNYSYSKDGVAQKVTADLSYKDINGNAVAGKDVVYEVQLDAKTVSKGKGKTDGQGNLSLSFINDQPDVRKSGIITTRVRLDDKRQVTKNFPVKSTNNDADVQFFPEGGDLIAGLASKIAFKASGADGLGIPITGHVIDNSGNRLGEFKSEHAGMGFFALRPQAGVTYKAVIKFDDGTEKSFALPVVQPKGYVLSVNNTDQEQLRLSISASPEFTDQEVVLIAQSNNKIHFVSKSKLTGTRITSNIPKGRFPQGILHLTLFTAQNEPVAERLVFINHQEQLKIDVSTPASEFKKREKVKLSLNVIDKENKPVFGSFSVSVVDETKVPYEEDNETTILSNLLLTSDLKGYIQSPNYFFTNIDSAKTRHLDNLMLTQGWRRFAWRDVLGNSNSSLVYSPEQNISISGKVTISGKPVANGKVSLFNMKGNPVLVDTLTDAGGRFRFNNLYFPDSAKVVIQARTAKDRKFVNIEMDQIPAPLITRNKNSPDIEVNINKTLINYLKNSMNQFDSLRLMGSGSIMLGEVKVTESKLLKNSANLNGAGNADAVITEDKLTHCTFDLAQCLESLVTGLVVRDGLPYLNRNLTSSIMLPTHMLVVVDGMDVEPDYLSLLYPGDVESIEVLKSAINTSIYGTKGVGGVLIITMKRGDYALRKNSYTPGIINFQPQGFNKVREFYSPNYNDPKTNATLPDLRTTVYWNPQVITNKEGNGSVEFFNADGSGTYRVTVEGINEAGNIGRSVYRYKVK